MDTVFLTKVYRPFDDVKFKAAQNHVKHVRALLDWPGVEYPDKNEPPENRFNRWQWHNLPWLVAMHHSPAFIQDVSETVGEEVKPSYVFLSMYGSPVNNRRDSICPPHTDRPQCKYTVDLVFDQDAQWPIYIGDKADTPLEGCQAYTLGVGEALIYSGTDHRHYRKQMNEDSKATFCDLAFFHFVPVSWMGRLE